MKKKTLVLCLGVLFTLSLSACEEGQYSITSNGTGSYVYDIGDSHAHTADTDWHYDESKPDAGHWHVCVDDGLKMNSTKEAHTFTYEVIEPTCTIDGCTNRICDVCGAIYTSDVVAAPGHIEDEWHDKAAHITYKYCAVCHEVLETITTGENLYYFVTSECVHTEKCKYCEMEIFTESHEDLDNDGNCDICGCLSALNYTIDNNEVTITGVGDYAGTNLVFPNTIKGYPVTIIAISSENYDFSNIETISIPASIISVSDYSFRYCTSLTNLFFEFGSQLNCIGHYAFFNCPTLIELTIPSTIESIGRGAFFNCTSLTSITFEEDSQLTTIGAESFTLCESLLKLIIPSSVKEIGDSAFCNCTSLTSITFEEDSQLESIGVAAFDRLAATYLSIPASVKEIGNFAFGNATQLKEVYIEGSEDGTSQLTTLGAVFACGNVVPGGGLKTITLPGSITTITSSGFDYLFRNCTRLSTINFYGTRKQWLSFTDIGYLSSSVTINCFGGII